MSRYASGRLLFTRGGVLMSQEFDVERFSVRGEATPIAQLRQVQAPTSGNGVLAYGGALPPRQLTWFSRAGKALETVGDPAIDVRDPRVSPDGVTIAFNRFDTGPGMSGCFEPRRGAYQFTFRSDSEYPIWSPDGSQVAFSVLVGGGYRHVRKARTA